MALLPPAAWGAAADAGDTTWSVGKAGAWYAAYSSFREAASATEQARAEAMAGADAPGLFRWDGHHGRPVPSADLDDWLAVMAAGDPRNEARAIEERLTARPRQEAASEADAEAEAQPGDYAGGPVTWPEPEQEAEAG